MRTTTNKSALSMLETATLNPQPKKAKKSMTTQTRNKKTPAAAATGTTTTTTPAAPPAASGGGATFAQPPPSGTNIPTPPSGYVASVGTAYRRAPPTAAEQLALSGAIDDLKGFTQFAQVFGLLGVTDPQVVQMLDVGNQWTTARNQTAAWDGYAADMERLAWAAARAMMKKMKPLFTIAAAQNPSLLTSYPSLAALFSAQANTAKQAVATRRLNKAAIAAGKPPTHGAVGKKRQKATAKALLLSAQTGGAKSQTGPTGTSPSTGGPGGTTH